MWWNTRGHCSRGKASRLGQLGNTRLYVRDGTSRSTLEMAKRAIYYILSST